VGILKGHPLGESIVLKVRFVALCLVVFAVVWLSGQIPSSNARVTLPSTPTVKVRYQYYSVSGATAQQVRSQLSQRGPVDRISGSRFDAITDWKVRWTYHYRQSGQQCVVDAVHGNVNILFTLPKWNQPARAGQSLISEWNDYYAALKTHENGHKANGVAAIKDILQTLATLPTYAFCGELEVAANAAAQRVMQAYNQQDREYDRLTRHGFTQGAIFPSMSTVSR
jgi:predicted secreted Zn-dependent protease